jgi:acyl carrier protein
MATGEVGEFVQIIAEEIHRVTDGEIATDDVSIDSELWMSERTGTSIGLSSLHFFELVYRVEQRTGTALPASLEPAMVATVRALAARLRTAAGADLRSGSG